MERKETVFDYLEQIFIIFGITIAVLNIFCLMFGEEAKAFSSMFALGKNGLSVPTMVQFFFVSVIIATLRFILFTDGLIKNISIIIRIISMFGLVLVTIITFIFCFHWFPTDMWQAWAMFFLCFGISVGLSTWIATLKERKENQKMEEALQRFKMEEQAGGKSN